MILSYNFVIIAKIIQYVNTFIKSFELLSPNIRYSLQTGWHCVEDSQVHLFIMFRTTWKIKLFLCWGSPVVEKELSSKNFLNT